jgi:hypothetical protein
VHAPPFDDFGTHEPDLQYAVALHWVSSVHALGHEPVATSQM